MKRRLFFIVFLFYTFHACAQGNLPSHYADLRAGFFQSETYRTSNINYGDTVIFDLFNAVCTGSKTQFAVSFSSDDEIYAVDFSFKLNRPKLAYDSLIVHQAGLMAAASYNAPDSTLRFTSFSMVPLANNNPLVSLRFILVSGQLQLSDFRSVIVYLNGDLCSYKIKNAPAPAYIAVNGPSVFMLGDSVMLTAHPDSGFSYSWSTGETTQSITADTTGSYIVLVTSGTGCQTTYAVNLYAVSPLPIELLDFTTASNENGILVKWSTASEANNDYFTIERSADLFDWQEITRINGAGNSSSMINYSYLDIDPLNAMNYYRLKQTDYDRSFTYSAAIARRFTMGRGMLDFKAFPNPANEKLNVMFSEHGSVCISDLEGREVYRQNDLQPNQKFEIDTQGLDPGIYTMHVFNGSRFSTSKIVIVH